MTDFTCPSLPDHSPPQDNMGTRYSVKIASGVMSERGGGMAHMFVGERDCLLIAVDVGRGQTITNASVNVTLDEGMRALVGDLNYRGPVSERLVLRYILESVEPGRSRLTVSVDNPVILNHIDYEAEVRP